MYPYLDKHLRLAELSGRKVLEVGLGYGSVAQRLAQHGAI
jgi:2-polyprenyl-3-methyl-5-hydroxy-6-metoxy-1,4-benzoquinol methylase